MAKATAISIAKLTATVNTAVAAAGKKFPNLPVKPPNEVSYFPYLILGFPVPEPLAQAILNENIGTLNAFANEVAGHLAGAEQGGVAGAAAGAGSGGGAVFSFGGHIIMGRNLAPPAAIALGE